MQSRRGGCVVTRRSHHPARKSLTPAPLPNGEGRVEIPSPKWGKGMGWGLAGTPPGPPRCIASGVRRLERAQAPSSKPRLTLRQEGSRITIHGSRFH